MSTNWWANKLGTNAPVSNTPPTGPARNPVYRPQPSAPNPRVAYDAEQDQLVSKAQSARDAEKCPGCYSPNYMAPQGTQKKRCYDCGYPLVQSGSGVGTTGQSTGPVMAARQPAQGSGFNPKTIVGRLE